MEDTNTDGSEVLETTETDTAAVETTEADERDARIAKLEKEKEELEGKNKQLYARVKKGEVSPIPEAPSQTDGLSPLDAVALAKADVHDDDIDMVIKFAKFEGISVRDAIKNPMLKSMLDTQAEERKTAAATQTKGGQRGASKTTGNDLLAKAERLGEMPDTDDGMRALAQARIDRKRAATRR